MLNANAPANGALIPVTQVVAEEHPDLPGSVIDELFDKLCNK